METKHTPTPWRIDHRAKTAVVGSRNYVVAACGGYANNTRDQTELSEELEANAEFIVLACNVHDELVAALKALHACHRAFSNSENWTALDDEARAAAERAIAKARGEG